MLDIWLVLTVASFFIVAYVLGRSEPKARLIGGHSNKLLGAILWAFLIGISFLGLIFYKSIF